MKAMFDSSVLIAHERRQINLVDWIEACRFEGFAISSIVAAEIMLPMYRGPEGVRQIRRAFVTHFISNLPQYSFGHAEAMTHARLEGRCADDGVKIGVRDLLIAATAITQGFAVVTYDQRSFPNIPELDVELLPRQTSESLP